tara:strand:- start:356 stop:724 length:369 start_codon:yes stop_codon:yes gene_type:complete
MLTDVLNHMPGVHTKTVSRWPDPQNPGVGDLWAGIWTNATKMEKALAVIIWQPGSKIPTPAEVIAARPAREAFEAEAIADEPKRLVEEQLRNNPNRMAEVALQARAEGKTTDEIIAETVAKV